MMMMMMMQIVTGVWLSAFHYSSSAKYNSVNDYSSSSLHHFRTTVRVYDQFCKPLSEAFVASSAAWP